MKRKKTDTPPVERESADTGTGSHDDPEATWDRFAPPAEASQGVIYDPRLVTIDLTTYEYAPIREAYTACKEALETASAGTVRAFFRAVWHDPPRKRFTDGALAAAGFVVGAAAADPLIGAAAGTLGFFARNAWFVLFGRTKGRNGRPEIPKELRSVWNMTCFRFYRLVNGYNIRVEMVRKLRNDAERLKESRRVVNADSFREFEQQLMRAHPKLIEIAGALVHLAAEDLEERDERVIEEDLLGHFEGREIPEISWLDDDSERIRASKVAEKIREDLAMIGCEDDIEDFLNEANRIFSELGDHDDEDIVAAQRAKNREKND